MVRSISGLLIVRHWPSTDTPGVSCAVVQVVEVGMETDAGAMAECLFCEIITTPVRLLAWYDQPILRVPGVGAVIPALGAFVPGYVLVFPELHVRSRLAVPRYELTAFEDLVTRAVSAVRRVFGELTVFEHGSCDRADVRRSACMDHAHVHLMPGSYDLSRHVPSWSGSTSDVSNLRAVPDRIGYLYLQEPDSAPRFGEDPGVSQFFRRKVATYLGVDDEWDYLLYPRLGHVRQTIERLAGRIA
jgi:diadenosine tetraphosphate (Ap4A) HIT family hydrolase